MATVRRSLLDAIGEAAEKKSEPRKRLPPRVSPRVIEEVKAEVLDFVNRNDWSEAKLLHLIGLYVVAHEHVYKVPPLEMDGATWFLARRAAEKLVEECFAGNIENAMKFVQWAWVREGEREEWRKSKGIPTTRLGWRLLFSKHLLTDYFVNLQRAPLPR